MPKYQRDFNNGAESARLTIADCGLQWTIGYYRSKMLRPSSEPRIIAYWAGYASALEK